MQGVHLIRASFSLWGGIMFDCPTSIKRVQAGSTAATAQPVDFGNYKHTRLVVKVGGDGVYLGFNPINAVNGPHFWFAAPIADSYSLPINLDGISGVLYAVADKAATNSTDFSIIQW